MISGLHSADVSSEGSREECEELLGITSAMALTTKPTVTPAQDPIMSMPAELPYTRADNKREKRMCCDFAACENIVPIFVSDRGQQKGENS